jgi:hypothetical protein
MSWEGEWAGRWPGLWAGGAAGEPGGGYADGGAIGGGSASAAARLLARASLSAVGFGFATGTVLSGDTPAAEGGGSARWFFAPRLRPVIRPARQRIFINGAAIGIAHSTGTATATGAFDATGRNARRILMQRRNTVLALAA